MPPPPKSSDKTEPVRLANIFVRVPLDEHDHQRGNKRVAVFKGQKGGASQV